MKILTPFLALVIILITLYSIVATSAMSTERQEMMAKKRNSASSSSSSSTNKNSRVIKPRRNKLPRNLKSKKEIENFDTQRMMRQDSHQDENGGSENNSLQSSTLADSIYCKEDVQSLCYVSPGEPQKWGTFNGNEKDIRSMTATECLEQQLSKIESEDCRLFIQSRKYCLAELGAIDDCQDLKPVVDITDRHEMRKTKMESRKARLELRKKLHGGRRSKMASADLERRSRSERSKSQSESISNSNNDDNDENNNKEASPSLSFEDDLLSPDEKKHMERYQAMDARLAADKKEAEQSSKRNDHFMSLCASLISQENSQKIFTQRCKNAKVFQHLPFGDDSLAEMAERKRKMHESTQRRIEHAQSKHKKMFENIKDRATRHHLDKLDEEIDSGKTVLSETEDDERGRFLLNERRNREIRRRRHMQKLQQKHGKQLEQMQEGDLPTKFSTTMEASSSKSQKMEKEKSHTEM